MPRTRRSNFGQIGTRITTISEYGYHKHLTLPLFCVPAHGTPTQTPPPRRLASGSGRGAPRCSRRRRLRARSASSRRARTHRPPARGWSQRRESAREPFQGASERERGHRPGGGRRRLGRCPRGGRPTSPPARAPFRAIPLSVLYQTTQLEAFNCGVAKTAIFKLNESIGNLNWSLTFLHHLINMRSTA
jgi:hypothetical protein